MLLKFKIAKKFLIYLKPHIKNLSFMFLAVVMSQMCSLMLPSLMVRLIDVGIKQNGIESEDLRAEVMSLDQIIFYQTSYILKLGGLMLIVTLASVLFTVYIYKLKTQISSSISSKLRQDVFYKLMNFSYAKASEFSSSSLMTRLTNDVEEVQSFVMLATQFIIPPVMMMGGIVMAIAVNPSMVWIIILGGMICAGIVFGGMKLISSRTELIKKLEDKFSLVIKEQLSGVRVIRGFGNELFEENRFKNASLELTNISLFISNVTALMSPVLTVFSNFLTVYILLVSSAKVNAMEMQVGEVVAFMQYTLLILGAFVMMSLILSMIPRFFVSMQRISEILDSPLELKEINRSLELKDETAGCIEFKGVSFSYAKDLSPALKDVSFKIDSGSTVAIVGSVGSGKSSLLKLILGFYDPSEGKIEFDGKDVKYFKREDMLKKVSYISQKPFLFSGTVESNLKFGNLNLSEDEMKNALKIVNLDKLVEDEGLKTPVLQSGSNLSGGQKQRLSIARGIIKKADIYIFDDAFSALDFKTEFLVRNAILEYLKNKTIFLVSQRIGTIKNSDKIIVLREGKVVSIGVHQELLENCKVYRKMFEVQMGSKL